MDQIEEFYEYTSRNPLNQILDQYRSSQDFQNGSLQELDNLFLDIHNYIRIFNRTTNNHAVSILALNINNFQSKILNRSISISEFARLIYLVNVGCDREIWEHIILISDVYTRPPPPILPDLQIPMTQEKGCTVTLSRNVTEQEAYDSTRNNLEEALRAELTRDTYKAVDGFWEQNFAGKSWYGLTTLIWERYRDGGQCGVDNVFSENMDEERVKSWFRFFYSTYLEPFRAPPQNINELPSARDPNQIYVRGKFSYTENKTQLKGGRCDRQVDVFMEHTDMPYSWDYHWRDVRVVGELTKSANKKSAKFHQLTLYVREVFYAQPLRRFVHGFCLHKKHVVFWIVDRSGAYSSSKINVIEDQEKLVRALSSYTLMSDEELGLDTTIRVYNGNSFIRIRDNDLTSKRWVQIDPEPVSRPETIVARANTCFRTMDMSYLIKFSWGSGTELSEIDFLKAARGAYGVVDLIWSDEIYQVQTHRAGLDFSTVKRWDMGKKNWLSIGTQGEPEEYFKRRKLTLAVTSPYGRPFKTCTSLWEFLSGMLDAILGHRNLYVNFNILHGDISESNIILTRSVENGSIQGKLIDLDMSINVTSYNEATSITGTMKFMALKVLKNIGERNTTMLKTYRHDLESFFYVFLVGCVCYGRGSGSHDKYFTGWSSRDVWSNFGRKTTDVGSSFQQRIIDQFSPRFNGIKELAFELRLILFGEGANSFDTPRYSAVLYDPIIAAFKKTIDKINNGIIANETWTLRA